MSLYHRHPLEQLGNLNCTFRNVYEPFLLVIFRVTPRCQRMNNCAYQCEKRDKSRHYLRSEHDPSRDDQICDTR